MTPSERVRRELDAIERRQFWQVVAIASVGSVIAMAAALMAWIIL